MSRARRERGFTLIEMAVVVTIVGILAILAILGYHKLLSSSRTAEATDMVQRIGMAQEEYKGLGGPYANISQDITPGKTYPAKNPGAFVSSWDPINAPCNWCTNNWNLLTIKNDTPLMYGYATVAGPAGVGPTATPPVIQGTSLSWPSNWCPTAQSACATPTTDWYATIAFGDTDGDGVYCTVFKTSWMENVLVDKEGE